MGCPPPKLRTRVQVDSALHKALNVYVVGKMSQGKGIGAQAAADLRPRCPQLNDTPLIVCWLVLIP